MKAFVWNRIFETGIASVDAEHRALVEIVNRLGALMIEGKATPQALGATFGELATYATQHFANEEGLMAKAGVDERHLAPHRAHHRRFVEQLKGMWKRRDEMDQPVAALHGFLTSWLSFHILEEDQAMAHELAQIAQGQEPALAHEAWAAAQEATAGQDKPAAVLLGAMHQLYGVLSQQNQALADANERLEAQVADRTRSLLQAEKMAAVGQLAAGVAHEINNPIGFVNSNLGTLKDYAGQLLTLLDDCAREAAGDAALSARLEAAFAQVDLPYVREDLKALLQESQEGLDRVKHIVQALKDFAHVDAAEMQDADLLAGLESTLKVATAELKYKAEVVRELTALPRVHCMPGQINQVFMNLLVNAAQAIPERGRITLRSGYDDAGVWVSFTDTGCGIPAENISRLFEPFYTTKPIGKGTGLGLALSWDIIVNKHGGRIEVSSQPGQGSCFTVWLPRPAD